MSLRAPPGTHRGACSENPSCERSSSRTRYRVAAFWEGSLHNKSKKAAALAALVVAAVAVKVWADGIPTQTPLAYSGVLQDSVGNPITTPQSIQLTLWDDASANASLNQKCSTPTQSVTPDSQGRFRIVLDQACFGAVQASPNLWVQLQVGATVLPRSKLNAVPYAVEAGKATRVVVTMGTAGADGGVRTTVDGVYCGAAANTNGAFTAQAGSLTGLRAGKFLCEQACSSPTAHMCGSSEALRSHELGGSLPNGWLKGGWGTSFSLGGATSQQFDCYGWTVGPMAAWPGGYLQLGATWDSSNRSISNDYCNSTIPILCCD
ncbi:MAG: hypothetical protein JNK82_16310 [Myxococcaceae bacterium]|nr:hypothetical protein [Myxococcaceae bacterium]